ncbi:MAG: type II toxin-antitoxin system RelE/ParE family toxin [Thiohalorhabdaceae bacterium]
MSQVAWLPEALQDVERLYDFLHEHDPQAARNAVLCIQAVARQLAEFPEIGKPMSDGSGRREAFAAFGAGAYVLRYRLEAERPVVIRVWHTRERR